MRGVDDETRDEPKAFAEAGKTLPQIEAVLNTIPLGISLMDENDINSFFNAGEKPFRRPADAVGREVYVCYPPKYAAMV